MINTELINNKEQALVTFKNKLIEYADTIVNSVLDLGLIGTKLPGGYMVARVGGDEREYILLQKGINICNKNIASDDNYFLFKRDIGNGLMKKIEDLIEKKTQKLLKSANDLFSNDIEENEELDTL